VVDAAILVAAARGRSSAAVLNVAQDRALTTTDRAFQEAQRRIELGMKRSDLLPVLQMLAADIAVVRIGGLAAWLPAAQSALRDAVPSRNGSMRDAHILALAWNVDADIWTTDRDFVGTGTAVWSTPNLLVALAEARAA
jgi:predicted nucleic acid-binding protein